MNKLEKFKELEKHPLYGIFIKKKLKKHEYKFCLEYIKKNESSENWYKGLSVLFLDKPELRYKYKNWGFIVEILSSC